MNPIEPSTTPDYQHKEYPRQFRRDDFWRQIKRTVNGQPVSEGDIDLIVSQIAQQLRLQTGDHLLDLGCGNGALASRLLERLNGYVGVDFSTYLLEVAREYFQVDPSVAFIEADMRDVDRYRHACADINKVLIYGAISYLTRNETELLLQHLTQQLPKLRRVFVGNVADAERASEFFARRQVTAYSLDDPRSPIGVWWTPDVFVEMSEAIGFQAQVVRMPTEFYGSAYRFDILLQLDGQPGGDGAVPAHN